MNMRLGLLLSIAALGTASCAKSTTPLAETELDVGTDAGTIEDDSGVDDEPEDVVEADSSEEPDTDPEPDTVDEVDVEEPEDTAPVDDVVEELPCVDVARIREYGVGFLPQPRQLCEATITMVTDEGFYFQEVQNGPGLYYYGGSEFAPDRWIEPGAVFTGTISELSEFRGTLQVTTGALTEMSKLRRVDPYPLAQSLGAGVAPAEYLESELVRISNAVLEWENGQNISIAYGSAEGVRVRLSEEVPALCEGARFELYGVVTEFTWDEGPAYQIVVPDVLENLFNIDTDDCWTMPVSNVEVGDLVINEVLADPAADADSNCDGSADTGDDEFVEFVNVSGNDLNAVGLTLSDATSTRYTFDMEHVIPAGGVVVIYGGGEPGCDYRADVQAISASSLGLNNGGDTVTLAVDGVEIDSFTFSESANDQSWTRSPAVTGDWQLHSETAGSHPFSPGEDTDHSRL